MSILFHIDQLPNRKWYGEMVVGHGKECINVDVVCAEKRELTLRMLPGVRTIADRVLKDFIKWRWNSLEKADRLIYLETQFNLGVWDDVRRRIAYSNFEASVRLIAELRGTAKYLAPKKTNYLWEGVNDLIAWAEHIKLNGVDAPVYTG